MAKQPETLFWLRIKPKLKLIPNSEWHKTREGEIGRADIIGRVNDKYVALELKRSDKANKRPMQIYRVNKTNSEGGFARFIYPENFDKIYSYLLKL